LTKQMECRNKDCASCGEKFVDGTGCGMYSNVTDCNIYNRLLPLWEFQDKWEDKLKNGFEYKITERIGGKYLGRILAAEGWYPCHWNNKGVCRRLASWSLIPKKPKQKEWYGLVDKNSNLISICQKNGIPLGWRVVKLTSKDGLIPSHTTEPKPESDE